jgi:hypothetical protein
VTLDGLSLFPNITFFPQGIRYFILLYNIYFLKFSSKDILGDIYIEMRGGLEQYLANIIIKGAIERKMEMSKAKQHVKREVQVGRKLTIDGALRVAKSLEKGNP